MDLEHEDKTIRFGELYFRFDQSAYITVGWWNQGDIDTLDLKDMVKLRKYLENKISKTLMKVK